MRLDDAIAHRQAESCSLSHALGGEERVEDLPEVLLGDPAAVIGDGHVDLPVFLPCAYPNGPSVPHGVERILQQVQEDLSQLAVVGLDRGAGLLERKVERKCVTLDLALPQPGPTIQADDGQLRQVFLNLLQNALDAVRDAGTIQVSARQEDGEIDVAITDDGCGIPEEHLGKIFDPFFSTKGVGKGTGLGLSVSYGIIQAHGGRISVESRPGSGSTFHVWLPAASEARAGDPRMTA